MGDWRSAHPRFDDPLSWSLPIGHAGGVTVRVHALFLVVIVIALLKSVLADPGEGAATPFDLPRMLVALGALFLLVLAHETGHVVACRTSGGDADEILIWPLGGLAWCSPPPRWTAELWTALGGPLVNLAIWCITATLLGLMAGWRTSLLLPNPFSPAAFVTLSGRDLEALFIVHWVNWILLLINLLPMIPLDGGQALRAMLSRRMEAVEAARTAARVGFIMAIVVMVAAIVIGSWVLGAVAFVGGLTCFISMRRIEFTDAMDEGLEDPRSLAERQRAERMARRRAALEARRRDALEQEDRKLDEILAKIGREGRAALTWSERRFLKRATKRRRGQ